MAYANYTIDENILQQLLQPYIDDGYTGENLEIIKKKIIQNHKEQEALLKANTYPWVRPNRKNQGQIMANFKPIGSTDVTTTDQEEDAYPYGKIQLIHHTASFGDNKATPNVGKILTYEEYLTEDFSDAGILDMTKVVKPSTTTAKETLVKSYNGLSKDDANYIVDNELINPEDYVDANVGDNITVVNSLNPFKDSEDRINFQNYFKEKTGTELKDTDDWNDEWDKAWNDHGIAFLKSIGASNSKNNVMSRFVIDEGLLLYNEVDIQNGALVEKPGSLETTKGIYEVYKAFPLDVTKTITKAQILARYGGDQDQYKYYDFKHSDEMETTDLEVFKKSGVSVDHFMSIGGSDKLLSFEELTIEILPNLKEDLNWTPEEGVYDEDQLKDIENLKQRFKTGLEELGKTNIDDLSKDEFMEIFNVAYNGKAILLFDEYQKENPELTLAEVDNVELEDLPGYDNNRRSDTFTSDGELKQRHAIKYEDFGNVLDYNQQDEEEQSKYNSDLNKKLRRLGWRVLDSAPQDYDGPGHGDKWGYDVIFIGPANGAASDYKAFLLPTEHNKDFGLFSDAEDYTDQWHQLAKNINQHIRNVESRGYDPEIKVAKDKMVSEIMDDMSHKKHSGQFDIFHLDEEVKEKMITVVKDELGVDNITDITHDQLIGIDWQRLLNQGSGTWFNDSQKQDIIDYYKNKFGQGYGWLGKTSETDMGFLGATSWEMTGDYAVLEEHHVEQAIEEVFEALVKEQIGIIQDEIYTSQGEIYKFNERTGAGPENAELLIKAYNDKQINNVSNPDAKEAMRLALHRHDIIQDTNSFDENGLLKPEIKEKLKDIENQIEDLRATGYDSQFVVTETGKFIFTDAQGNLVDASQYDESVGYEYTEADMSLYKIRVEEAIENIEASGELKIDDELAVAYNSVYGDQEEDEEITLDDSKRRLSKYEAVVLYRNQLIEEKMYRDFIGKKKVQIVVNDKNAWLTLDELSWTTAGKKPPTSYEWYGKSTYTGDGSRVKFVGVNENGRIYEVEQGILSEYYKQIIDGDGVNFWGDIISTAPTSLSDANIETRTYKSNRGYFAPLNEDEYAKFGFWDQITPWIAGNEEETTAFTNMLLDQRDDYRELIGNLQVADMIFLHSTDPATLTDSFIEETTDLVFRGGEVLMDALEYYGVEAVERNDQGEYIGSGGLLTAFGVEGASQVETSSMTKLDHFSNFMAGAGIDLTEDQLRETTRGAFYSAFENTVGFMPTLAEFIVTEALIIGLEAVTFGGATPVAAPMAAGALGRFTARLGARVGKELPGASRRANWYNKFMTSNKYYTTKNGRRLTDAQLTRLEKLTGYKRNTPAFNKAMRDGGPVGKGGRKKWAGNVKPRRDYLGTVKQFMYGGIREEVKMAIVFDEHYHVGGGFAFFGTGKFLGKAGKNIKFSEYSKINAGNLANIFNSGLQLGRHGLSGMIASPLAQTFEKFLIDIQGDKTFDFWHDMYPEITTKRAMSDFLMFSTLGIKGVIGPKGTGFWGVKRLRRFDNALSRLRRQKMKAGFDPDKKVWKDKKLEAEYDKYTQLHNAVQMKTNQLDLAHKWMDHKWVEKYMRKKTNKLQKEFKKSGYNVDFKFVNTLTEIQKNGGRKISTKIGEGNAADFSFNKETSRWEITIDVSRTTPGKLPHEIQHMMDMVVFEGDANVARNFKTTLEGAFKGEKFYHVPVMKNGKYTGEYKSMSLNEMIENMYGKSTETMKAWEYSAYVAEILSNPTYYSKFTKDGRYNTWKKLTKAINKFHKETHGQGTTGTPLINKQLLVQFLGKFAQSIKKGTLTSKQIDLYKKLAETQVLDQNIGFVGTIDAKTGQMMSMKSKDLIEQRESLREVKKEEGKKFIEDKKGLDPVRDKERIDNLRDRYKDKVKEIDNKLESIEKDLKQENKDKKFENDIQRIYETSKNKEEAAWEIARQYDPRETKSAGAARINQELRKYEKLPNFEAEKGNILNDLLYDSNRSIRAEVLKYKEGKVPASGYIGSILSKRGISESVSKFIKEGAKFSVEFEGKFVQGTHTDDAVIEYNIEAPMKEGVSLVKALKIKPETVKQIESKIKDLDLNNISFAKLKDLAPELTKEMFGKGPQARAEYIVENWKTIYDLMPEGAISKSGKTEIEGLSTKIKPAVLKAFYQASARSTYKETGKGAGLKVQEKLDIKNKEQFLEKVGLKTTKKEDGIIKGKEVVEFVNPKGSKEYRGVTESLFPGIIAEVGRMITNQVVRDAISKGKLSEKLEMEYSIEQFDMMLGAGKSPSMKSKDLNELDIFPDKNIIKKEISVRAIGKKDSKKFIEETTRLTLDIAKKGVENVYDKNLNLLPEYKNVPKYMGDFVLKELYARDLIMDVKSLGEATAKIFREGLDAGLRGNGYNQHLLNIVKKVPNIKVVNKKVTEKGGAADMTLELHGNDFMVEVKMANAQYGSVSLNYNLTNGKTRASKEFSFNDMLNEMVKEAAPAWKKLSDRVYELSDGTIRIEKSGQTVPPEIWKQLKKEGLTTDITVQRPFDIKNIAEFYNKKEIPNFYIQIQGKGAYFMGTDVLSLKLPELKGEAIMTVRLFPVTSKAKGKQGHKHLYYRAVPQIKTGTLKKSTVNLGSEVGWKDFMNSESVKRLESLNKDSKVIDKNSRDLLELASGVKSKDLKAQEAERLLELTKKAIELGRKGKKDKRGMSTFDFDETIIDKGENFILAKDPVTKRQVKISSSKWPIEGPAYSKKGWEFDFKDFINVRGGVKGPLFKKLQNQIKKYGPDNVYILTARPPQSAEAIHAWLKSKGVDIPLKNITGLGNSTGEAKALWMLEKFAEGYNDMYFVDDALPNVKAVKDVLGQLDVKSKVQQAISMKSKDLSKELNDMIERKKGIDSKRRFSEIEARLEGDKKGRWKILPHSADDFAGLLYNLLGKGKQGEKDMRFFESTLFEPFGRGINNLNSSRQKRTEDYKALLKKFPKSKKNLKKKIEGTYFTKEQAVRVFMWNRAGFDIPGLSKADLKTLVDVVKNDADLRLFANNLSKITRGKKEHMKPSKNWVVETIGFDLFKITKDGGRKEFIKEWIENKDIIFSKENLNKIEAAYGQKFRESLEDILYRMETGRHRTISKDSHVNKWMNFMNNSTAGIMFFNMRSALLQTISSINYVNWSFNNPLKAGMAFANQKQYWKDFVYIFNSSMLKQRRSGLRMNINEAELAEALVGQTNKAKAALGWLLKKGFLPTQIADSFAIASGGATFYRNRVKDLLKRKNPKTGKKYTKNQAEKQAWLEFQRVTETAQQSSRPDLISKQQASPLGRFILAFANTPMQYARIQKKAMLDLINRRGDTKSNISKIIYYGLVQAVIFNGLQSAYFAALGGEDEEDLNEKENRMLQNMVDTQLVGFGGFGGRVISQVKNTIMEYFKQREKDLDKSFVTQSDHAYTLLTMLNISPPFGKKMRNLYSAIQTEKFNRGIIKERGLHLDNPALDIVGNLVALGTNFPLDRFLKKYDNISAALDSNNETWQRIALTMGWSTWDFGIKDPDLEQVKLDLKEKKKLEREKENQLKLEEKKIEKIKEKYPNIKEEDIDKTIIKEEKTKQIFDLNKREQVKILEANNLNPKDYPKEADRVEAIMNLRNKDEEKIDSTLTAIENYVPTEEEQVEIDLFKMNKKDQVNLLMELGLSTKQIKKLKYEKDRVEMIIKLQKKKKK